MMDSGAELTVLELSDMSRCLSCRRLVTLRRILSFGSCKCGARKLVDATFLDEADLMEIEEDYGWEVKIEGVGVDNVSKGLLQRGNSSEAHDGKVLWDISEERLHSREAGEFRSARDRAHRKLAEDNWWYGLRIRNRFKKPADWFEYLKQFRKPQFFFGSKDVQG